MFNLLFDACIQLQTMDLKTYERRNDTAGFEPAFLRSHRPQVNRVTKEFKEKNLPRHIHINGVLTTK